MTKETARKITQASQRTTSVVRWPGRDWDVSVLDLRCSEIQAAYFAARDVFARKGYRDLLDVAAKAAFDEELETQYVWRMLIDADSRDPKDRVFATVDECRAELSADERGFFSGEHMRQSIARVATWAKKDPTDG